MTLRRGYTRKESRERLVIFVKLLPQLSALSNPIPVSFSRNSAKSLTTLVKAPRDIIRSNYSPIHGLREADFAGS